MLLCLPLDRIVVIQITLTTLDENIRLSNEELTSFTRGCEVIGFWQTESYVLILGVCYFTCNARDIHLAAFLNLILFESFLMLLSPVKFTVGIDTNSPELLKYHCTDSVKTKNPTKGYSSHGPIISTATHRAVNLLCLGKILPSFEPSMRFTVYC